MRVVLVTPEYPPGDCIGGIATNAATVALELRRRGHDVFVVTRGEGQATSTVGGVTVVRLHRRWLPNDAAERLLATRQIAALVRRLRPDIIQAPEYEAEAWWLSRFSRLPLVTRLATPTYIVEQLNLGGPQRDTKLVRALERDQTLHSEAVFAPTRALADRVSPDWGLREDSVQVIPSPVAIEAVRRAGAGEPPRELASRFIVFIGRMERRKGVEVLGAALPEVLGAYPDLEAVFIGRDPHEEGGALMERFRQSVKPVAGRVHLLGELPHDAALAVVARSELVVLPSLWENLANTALETMALGRPLVASRAGGFVELIDHGRNGWLVPPGDVQALSSALCERLADPVGSQAVAKRARRDAEQFDVPPIVDRIVNLYEQAIDWRQGRLDRSIYLRGYRRHFRPDESRNPFRALYDKKRTAVVERFSVQPRMRLLDVGGGYGRLAEPLARYHDVTLCDISPEMIEEARRRCPPTINLVLADASRLPFGDGEFDAVLALDLLPHLPDLEAGITELARVARPGSTVVFDTTNAVPWWVLGYPSYVGWRPKRLVRTMLGQGVLPEWKRLVTHHTAADVRQALASSGLQLERLDVFGPRWCPKWHLWWTTG
jgi:glycogen(starch) synthase